MNSNYLRYLPYITIFIMGCIFNTGGGVGKMSEYKELQRFLKDRNYVTYDWPGSDQGSGLILEEKRPFGIVCHPETCFPSSGFPRQHRNLSDEQLVKTVARDYGVGLEVAMDKIQQLAQIARIPMPDNVKAEFNRAVESNVTLKLQNVVSEYIELGIIDDYIEQLNKQPESTCYKRISRRAPCQIIQEALKTDNLQYIFYKTGKGNLGMVIGWFGINFKAGVTTESEKAFVLNITTPQYFAYKSREVKVKEGELKVRAQIGPEALETREVSSQEILGDDLYLTIGPPLEEGLP